MAILCIIKFSTNCRRLWLNLLVYFSFLSSEVVYYNYKLKYIKKAKRAARLPWLRDTRQHDHDHGSKIHRPRPITQNCTTTNYTQTKFHGPPLAFNAAAAERPGGRGQFERSGRSDPCAKAGRLIRRTCGLGLSAICYTNKVVAVKLWLYPSHYMHILRVGCSNSLSHDRNCCWCFCGAPWNCCLVSSPLDARSTMGESVRNHARIEWEEL